MQIDSDTDLDLEEKIIHKVTSNTKNILDDIVLVNEQDEVIGTTSKLKAHELGLLHRAFSVFVYRKTSNGKFEFLLQQRQKDKYHCGGLWTNTCCSHPRLNEEITTAAGRRLKEEMSLELPLKRIGSFRYLAKFDNGLTEHELDHVLIGEYTNEVNDGSNNGPHGGRPQHIISDPNEVQAFRWISTESLLAELSAHKAQFTPWFLPALKLVLEELCINY